MFQNKHFAVRNARNKVVRGLYSALDFGHDGPLVIVPCQYEKVMRENIGIAMYLALNGFKVVRYDTTDHLGVSDGEHVDFHLHNVYDDFAAVLSMIRHRRDELRYTRLGVLAISLSGRPLLRYFAQENVHDVSLLVTLVGVLNVQDTLRRVMKGEDLIANRRAGFERRASVKVLKFEVSTHFLDGVIGRRYDDLSTTIEELGAIRTPMTFVVADKDDWIDPGDYTRVLSTNIPALQRAYSIPCSSHELHKNPPAAKTAMCKVVASFSKYLAETELDEAHIVKPLITEIIEQNKKEREFERDATRPASTERPTVIGEVVA